MSCTSMKFHLTKKKVNKFLSVNSFSEARIPLSWDELNVKGKSKTAKPPPAEVQRPTVRSENRCARLLGLLPPTTPYYLLLYLLQYAASLPCHYTFSIPSCLCPIRTLSWPCTPQPQGPLLYDFSQSQSSYDPGIWFPSHRYCSIPKHCHSQNHDPCFTNDSCNGPIT